jgi:hypothetical protein
VFIGTSCSRRCVGGALSIAKRLQHRSVSWPSVTLCDFLEQLLLQMAARCLFDCAPLCRDRFLLRLAFSPCSQLSGLRNVSDLWPMRAHFSLVGLRVRIHGGNLALFICDKKGRKRGKLKAH